MMRTLFIFLLVAPVFLVGTGYANDAAELRDPVLQQRYTTLTHELRCPQCQDQSIADSPASLAADLRRRVRELLLEGKSDQEIRDFMRSRYGEFVLSSSGILGGARPWWLVALLLLLVIGLVSLVRKGS